jgi:hypothetical protein
MIEPFLGVLVVLQLVVVWRVWTRPTPMGCVYAPTDQTVVLQHLARLEQALAMQAYELARRPEPLVMAETVSESPVAPRRERRPVPAEDLSKIRAYLIAKAARRAARRSV